MERHSPHAQLQPGQHRGLRRRDFLRLLATGSSTAALAALVAACGGSTATPTTAPSTASSAAPSAAPSAAASAAPSAAASRAPSAAPSAATGGGAATPAASSAASAAPAASSAASSAAASAAAAQDNPFGPAQKKGGTYVVVVGANGGYAQVFRGTTYYGSLTFWACKLLYTPLVVLDRNWGAQVFPGLATSWSWSADQKQLTMQLRKGVKFHDGKEFTAKDVEFTIKLMVRKEAYPSVQDVTIFEGGKEYKERTSEQLPGVQVLDDYTVKFSITAPSSVFLLNLTNTGMLPAHGFPADALTSPDDTEKLTFFTDKPFGTGPFKLKSFDLKTNITFEANRDYWRGAPNLEGIVFRMDVASPAMISGLRSGEFDGAYVGMMADANSLKDQQSLNLVTNHSLANEQIFIAAHDKAYLNEKVRQALLVALDVDTLSKTVGYGFPRPAPSVMMHPSLIPNANMPKYDFNLERAKQLLREGNWDASRKLILGVSSRQNTPEALHAAIINMWKAAGVEAEYKPFDPANNTKTWNARPHEYDVFQTSFAWLAYDPSSAYQSFKCPPESNYVNYCNTTFDDAMKLAIREGDPEKAKVSYQKAQTIVQTELPYMPIWIEPEIWAINKRMHGGNLARGPLNDVQAELWWKE